MSGQIPVKPDAKGIADSVRAAKKSKGLPPVHLWNPPFCGDLDMRIARDGKWYYQGSPINRHKLARLFSSILKKEGDRYYLVTPVEKVGISVEDAPFVAVDFDVSGEGEGQTLTFRTQMEDEAVAGPENTLRVVQNPDTGEPSPYVHIRAGLEALIDRKSFYRLIELGTEREIHGKQWFGLWSSGVFFPLIPTEQLS